MKLLISTILCLLLTPSICVAQDDMYYIDQYLYQRDSYHNSEVVPLLLGVVVGGFIMSQVKKAEPEKVLVCQEVDLYDSEGNYIKTERYCQEEQK